MLHDEEKGIGDCSGKEEVEHVDFERYLVAYDFAAVVTDCAQLGPKSVDRPLFSQILAIDASSVFLVTSLPIFFELRAKGEDVKANILQEVEFECLF